MTKKLFNYKYFRTLLTVELFKKPSTDTLLASEVGKRNSRWTFER